MTGEREEKARLFEYAVASLPSLHLVDRWMLLDSDCSRRGMPIRLYILWHGLCPYCNAADHCAYGEDSICAVMGNLTLTRRVLHEFRFPSYKSILV